MPAAHRERYYASYPKTSTLNLESPFTLRRNRCSRRPGNPDHHEPEYAIRVHLYGQPCDMRRSFDGLQAVVRHGLGGDPTDGGLYVFVNRRPNQTTFSIPFVSGNH